MHTRFEFPMPVIQDQYFSATMQTATTEDQEETKYSPRVESDEQTVQVVNSLDSNEPTVDDLRRIVIEVDSARQRLCVAQSGLNQVHTGLANSLVTLNQAKESLQKITMSCNKEQETKVHREKTVDQLNKKQTERRLAFRKSALEMLLNINKEINETQKETESLQEMVNQTIADQSSIEAQVSIMSQQLDQTRYANKTLLQAIGNLNTSLEAEEKEFPLRAATSSKDKESFLSGWWGLMALGSVAFLFTSR